MLVFRVIEDGEAVLVKAETPMEAIKYRMGVYIIEALKEVPTINLEELRKHKTVEDATNYYFAEIFQSCELLGELSN